MYKITYVINDCNNMIITEYLIIIRTIMENCIKLIKRDTRIYIYVHGWGKIMVMSFTLKM